MCEAASSKSDLEFSLDRLGGFVKMGLNAGKRPIAKVGNK
jgi:hypothetical protein